MICVYIICLYNKYNMWYTLYACTFEFKSRIIWVCYSNSITIVKNKPEKKVKT